MRSPPQEAILSHLGVVLAGLGAILGHLGTILGHLGQSRGCRGSSGNGIFAEDVQSKWEDDEVKLMLL